MRSSAAPPVPVHAWPDGQPTREHQGCKTPARRGVAVTAAPPRSGRRRCRVRRRRRRCATLRSGSFTVRGPFPHRRTGIPRAGRARPGIGHREIPSAECATVWLLSVHTFPAGGNRTGFPGPVSYFPRPTTGIRRSGPAPGLSGNRRAYECVCDPRAGAPRAAARPTARIVAVSSQNHPECVPGPPCGAYGPGGGTRGGDGAPGRPGAPWRAGERRSAAVDVRAPPAGRIRR